MIPWPTVWCSIGIGRGELESQGLLFCLQTIYEQVSSFSHFYIYFDIYVFITSANSAIFQLYHAKNKFIFNEMMMMMSALYKISWLSWVFIGLAHWNNSRQIDMSPHSLGHIIPIPSKPVFALSLYVVCFAEKQRAR
jgi:hypothetical protein